MFLVCIRHWILCFIKGELVNLYGFNLVPIESFEWCGVVGGGVAFNSRLCSRSITAQEAPDTRLGRQAQSCKFCLLLPFGYRAFDVGRWFRVKEKYGTASWTWRPVVKLILSYYQLPFSSCHILLSETSNNSFLFMYFKTLWRNWFWFDLLKK